MDKNAIKKYAVWARRELISRVSQKAAQYEITADGYGDRDVDSVSGRILSQTEKDQREALVHQIRIKGYEQVMEEAAYTWFNRFSALRFMEVNGYLPSYVRVFTDDENNFKPQILTEAINLDIDGLDMQKVYDLKNNNDNDELFKYLLITQCNALSSILPGMFQKIDDYTELLFPDNLLREGSVIERMITLIPEDNWTDQVQIIGWLYEGYNTERNELVYDGNMSKSKVTKDLLPAATTIFTPDWPIRYMVENSLGRFWLEGHPNETLKSNWKYYLDEAEQEPEMQAKLAEIRKGYAAIKPEEILCIDPCQGSGHILAYMFDVLVQIYETYGYSVREAAMHIVENNLWGLDIDDRASQLAYFSVMMKARQYDARFFKRGIQPHVYSIVESNNLDPHCVAYFVNGRSELETAIDSIITEFHDAKEYGSIINVTPVDFDKLYARFNEIKNEISIYRDQTIESLLPLVQVAQALAQKYHIIVTNPPYLSSARYSPKLEAYVKKQYPDVKADLSMVIYKRAIDGMANENGFVAFITTTSWMYLVSFEKFRAYIQNAIAFSSLVDYGTELFEGKVGHNPIVSWVVRRSMLPSVAFTSIRLVDYCYSRRDRKQSEYFNLSNRYLVNQKNLSLIPGSPIAYWISNRVLKAFENGTPLGKLVPTKKGLDTGDNDRFLRYWFEVPFNKVGYGFSTAQTFENSGSKWAPHDKGGEYRKWYGNKEWVINWERNGFELHHSKANLRSEQYYFHLALTWSSLSSSSISFRLSDYGAISNTAGSSLYPNDYDAFFLLSILNSTVIRHMTNIVSPTLNYSAGPISQLPIIFDTEEDVKVTELSKQNVDLARSDWNDFEYSWDFQKHPLIKPIPMAQEERTVASSSGNVFVMSPIEYAFSEWLFECDDRFDQLKANEEELNRIFIDIYGLQDELSPEVEDKDVTVRKADLKRDIRSFISYAVGCMFGRYSLDVPGLAYAGGEWDDSKYQTFIPDTDAILPICDDEYFEDDIVGRFIKFVDVVYGHDTLEENLRFIADALGGNGTSREVIRGYFINDFYADHCKIYQKRPIYWLFDSGKKNGFKCLIYMHRYQPDTIARIRTDYVHEQQSRYRTAIADLENRISTAGTSERVKLTKQLNRIQDQAEELRIYEEKIHHLADQMISIDLDDGVKKNYAIFQDVLAKIK